VIRIAGQSEGSGTYFIPCCKLKETPVTGIPLGMQGINSWIFVLQENIGEAASKPSCRYSLLINSNPNTVPLIDNGHVML
jgi:hypothetical protein